MAAYVLGEFGFLVAERPGMSGEEQFRILHQHWATCDPQTRAILISTYAKLANLYEECRPLVAPVFARCKNSVEVEIQQRSAEYAAMREAFSPEAVEDLLREMPPFEDKRQSALEQRLREKEGADSAAVAKAARPSAAQRQRAAQSAAAARAAEEVAAQQASEQNAVADPISPISGKWSIVWTADMNMYSFILNSLLYEFFFLVQTEAQMATSQLWVSPRTLSLPCERHFRIFARLHLEYYSKMHCYRSVSSMNM